MAVTFDDLLDLEQRAQALQDLKKEADFEPLATAFKRVVNISKGHPPGEVYPELFENPAEGKLLDAYRKVSREAEEKIDRKEYLRALQDLSSLRQPVDEFFEGVLVMAEDEKVKSNRLSMLANIAQLFFRIGDFSKITTG